MRQAEINSRIGGAQKKLNKNAKNFNKEPCQQRATTPTEGRSSMCRCTFHPRAHEGGSRRRMIRPRSCRSNLFTTHSRISHRHQRLIFTKMSLEDFTKAVAAQALLLYLAGSPFLTSVISMIEHHIFSWQEDHLLHRRRLVRHLCRRRVCSMGFTLKVK